MESQNSDAIGTMPIRPHPDAGLTPQQLQHLEQLLVIKRSELVAKLDVLNQLITARQDCSIADAAEAANLQEEALRASGIGDQHRHIIVEIDAARERLAQGHYGVSEGTGDPIGYARLALVPWARAGAGEEPTQA